MDSDYERHQKRLSHLRAKQDKLGTLEALIEMYESKEFFDEENLRRLKKRANEVREQLRVLSTTDTYDY